MRRRALLVALAVAGVACGDDDTPTVSIAPVVVVEVAAQPCTRPTSDRGLGVVVDDGLVATAAHTVDGPRRTLTADGRPAVVVAIDLERDLALLAVPTGAVSTPTLDLEPPSDAVVVTLDGSQPVRIVRTGTLIVTNVSDDTRSVRTVHTFEPGVAEGTSGAPLVTPEGAIAGIVLLDRGGRDRADAVTAGELSDLLDETTDAPQQDLPGAGSTCQG